MAPNAGVCPTCGFLPLQPDEPQSERTPRVEELLRCNHPPLDAETPELRHVIRQFTGILTELDEKIVKAKGILHHLSLARENAECRLNDAKQLLHPLRSIPDDILGVIFQHSAPSWEGSTPEDSLSPRGAPWLLSHVCRRWRNMVLSESPNLWTFLVLKLDDHSRHITPTQCVFKTYLCLERSRNRPLSVRLYSSASTFKDHPVLPLLQASAARWKTLKAVVPASSLEYFSGTPFPILRDLQIELAARPANNVITTFASLTSIVSFKCAASIALEYVDLPWTQIKEYAYTHAFGPRNLKALRKMTRLHKLDLAVGGTHPRITVPIPLPELLELHLTELRQAGPTHMNDIFGALEIQSLAYLSITFPDELIDRSMHFPPSHNALGNLTKLRISGNPVGHSGNIQRLLAFLCLTPNVVELRLELMELGEELIDGLDFTKTPRLPRLCVLDVSECTIGYIVEDFHGFWDMLESRTLRQTAEELTGAGGNADGRCLEKVCVPRWVYIHALDLRESNRGALDVECGFALDDDDDDSTESDDSTDSDAAV